MTALPPLSIVEVLPELCAALDAGRQVVLEAPPGAGKSTVVPLALLDASWRDSRRIVMLEPRRIAARAVAERMATLLGERTGERVGFRTRLETRVGPRTVIEVLTEGILTRMLQRDFALEGVACVIFDEFHERNLQGDLGLALALECQRHLRPELRLLVMSATLDGDALARVMGAAQIVRAPGRTFDVTTHYASQVSGTWTPASTNTPTMRGASGQRWVNVARLVAQRIPAALAAHEGDLLAFLPGAGEIRRVAETLTATMVGPHAGPHAGLQAGSDAGSRLGEHYAVLPLYGDLPAAEQDAVLRPDARGRRKVVLATNVAETSLTIDGVRIVIDSGLERRPRFDPATGMSRLETMRISRASADQRRGRAGRTAPGVCYRLWSESTQASLSPQVPAEIVEADLASLALELACWGTADPEALSWLDPPPRATYAQARDLLARLEALDGDGRVTELGRSMAALGVHPRLAHMMLRARTLGQVPLACQIAALLSERDPLRGEAGAADPDLRLRIDALHGRTLPPAMTADRAALRRIERVAQQLERPLTSERRRTTRSATCDDEVPARADHVAPTAAQVRDADGEGSACAFDESAAVGLLLAFAYPDRIGRAREGGGGRYLLANGRGAALPGPAALARSEYIVVATLDAGEREARIHLAAPVELALLLGHFGHLVHQETSVAWDARSESVAARRVRRLGELVLRDEPLRDAGPAALAAMLEGVRSMGLQCLPWTHDLEQWRARVAFGRQHDPRGDADWPDVSDAALLASADDWLGQWLDGVTRRDHLARVDLRAALHGLLDHATRRRLEALAPAQLTVPSGSRISIDYASGTPMLAVRLQEVFGLVRSPTVAEGRVPVTLELLSPARRPVQVTRDLESFWARGYHEVRRELKGRYPKHYWPEDPREATPTRRVRPPGA